MKRLINTHGFRFWEWISATPEQKERIDDAEQKIKHIRTHMQEMRESYEADERLRETFREMMKYLEKKALEANRGAGIQ